MAADDAIRPEPLVRVPPAPDSPAPGRRLPERRRRPPKKAPAEGENAPRPDDRGARVDLTV
jgi:hypothetical protein